MDDFELEISKACSSSHSLVSSEIDPHFCDLDGLITSNSQKELVLLESKPLRSANKTNIETEPKVARSPESATDKSESKSSNLPTLTEKYNTDSSNLPNAKSSSVTSFVKRSSGKSVIGSKHTPEDEFVSALSVLDDTFADGYDQWLAVLRVTEAITPPLNAAHAR